MTVTFVSVAIIAGIAVGWAANSRGRNAVGWAVYGFMLPLISFIHLMVLRDLSMENGRQRSISQDERECPFCAERIMKKATKCKHCGSEVTPVKPDPAAVRARKEQNEALKRKLIKAGYRLDK